MFKLGRTIEVCALKEDVQLIKDCTSDIQQIMCNFNICSHVEICNYH